MRRRGFIAEIQSATGSELPDIDIHNVSFK